MRERQTLPIVGVEGLDLERRAIGLRKQRDGAVGHCAVDIHQQDLNPLGTLSNALRNLHGDFGQTRTENLGLADDGAPMSPRPRQGPQGKP